MAGPARNYSEKPKRQRKRKARTEVSSDSSSSSSASSSDTDSSSDTEPSNKQVHAVDKKQKTKSKSSPSISVGHDTASESAPAASTQQENDARAEEAFDSFYLRQMTTEFAEDLDKVRSATDFNNASIGMLVDALKQGRSCFDKEERLSIGKPIALQNA